MTMPGRGAARSDSGPGNGQGSGPGSGPETLAVASGVRPFFTIGHSDRPIDEFIGLLREQDVRLLVDVRRLPGSRAHPQFDQAPLTASLAEAGIDYQRLAALGGLRGRSREVSPEVNGYWTNQSFHNYADYALSPAFHDGIEALLAEGSERQTAVMCSEAVWWRCHRRIVADYLIANGRLVIHIMGGGRIEAARLSAGVVIEADRSIHYPTGEGETA